MASNLKIAVRGRFCVKTSDGRDITPTFRKERGLLALLALSPDKLRTRAWLQTKLWSQSDSDKQAKSLRRALANLKKRFGSDLNVLETNRSDVWLSEHVSIDERDELIGKAEYLENVEVPDPEFDDWIRDIRGRDPEPKRAPTQTHQPEPNTSGTIALIKTDSKDDTDTRRFMDVWLVDALSRRLEAEGIEEIYSDGEPQNDRIGSASTVIHFELTSALDRGDWSVHLRILAGMDRRFLWSGRFSHPVEIKKLGQNLEIEAFVSQSITQAFMRYRSFRQTRNSPVILLHRAATNLYFQTASKDPETEKIFCDLSSGEASAVALAWRSFSKLIDLLEFKENADGKAEEAQSLLNEALNAQPGNPLVSAIAARISLDAFGDFDRAQFFADCSIASDDANPYSLLAQSRVELMRGSLEAAHEAALRARKAADGFAHIFAWDMEVCLTALGLGRLESAHDAAWKAHAHNPTHRAALRYLVALSALLGEHEKTHMAIKQLQQLEPDFQASHLLRPDYPVLTLRRTGYIEQLAQLPH